MGKSFSLPMDIKAIERCIPHRYPFLLLDRVIEVEINKRLVATKNISFSDPILQGHFPNNPLFPGVLIIEAMAQASAVLGYLSVDTEVQSILMTDVSNARFRRKVVPGDTLEFHVELEKARGHFCWFRGIAKTTQGEICAVASFSASMQ